MSHQRFFRCRLCGLPHELDVRVCPVIGMPIPASRSIIPSDSPPADDEQGLPAIPRAPAVPVIPGATAVPRPRASPSAGVTRPAKPPLAATAEIPARRADLDFGAGRDSPSPTMLGTVIDGRYKVQRVIAEGGMGIVFDAVHLELGRRVAIKALAKKFSEDAVAVTRFRNEARIAGALGHPNIVEVFDMGSLPDGAPYLVMERLEGETLGQRMKRERVLPIEDVVQITQQILSALAATHERKIVHRDLKPENVFLSRRAGLAPVVKLLDFGISKTVQLRDDDTGLTLTRAGFVMGTPTYMAPEQARGDRDLDGRVDLYAVGVLAYEMLLGRPPYHAKHPAGLVVEMQKNPPPAPRTLRPEISVGLEALVLKLMSLDRRKRFPTAGDALQVLTAPDLDREPVDPDDEATTRTALFNPPASAVIDPDASQKVQIFTWDKNKR